MKKWRSRQNWLEAESGGNKLSSKSLRAGFNDVKLLKIHDGETPKQWLT